jgi:hypothetical protein
VLRDKEVVFVRFHCPSLTILLDFNLFLLVFASSLTIASGYIINNFMTAERLN